MSPEDFGRRLLAECEAAFERAADVQLDQTGQRPTWTTADEWALARLHAVVAPLLRRLVDAEEAGEEPGTVDAREAEAWAAFQAASDAPSHARQHFVRVLLPLIEPRHPVPYMHGDSRVDRWQLIEAGHYPPHNHAVGAPEGFEPLAAWSPLCPAPAGFVWERPLRAVEVPR